MSSGGVQDFEAGEQPLAAKFAALVNAVRGLAAQQGIFAATRRAGRTFRMFTPAGRAIALTDAEGNAKAQASESLWQMGPHVQVLPTAAIEGVGAAFAEAGSTTPIELYEMVRWAQNSAISGDEAPTAYTLAPEQSTYTARIQPDDPDTPDPEPETEEEWNIYNRTGQFLLGCIMTAPGTRGQRQRQPVMWPMPQHPCCIYKGGSYTNGRWGEPFLLPAPTAEQVLSSAYVPDYSGSATYSPRPNIYYAELCGRLDKYGRLQFATSLYHAGRRP